MKKITKKWFEYAAADFKAAKILFQKGVYEQGIYHCHQSLEKYLKALVVEKGVFLRKTHDLVALTQDAKSNLPQELKDFISEINPYYQPARYPDTSILLKIRYTKTTAKKFLKLTETTIKWLLFQFKQEK